MQRVTQKDLERLCKMINTSAGTPLEQYTKGNDGQFTPNAKCYHLDYAYGGVCLVQMCDEGSGIHTIIAGFMPKRELYNRMTAYLDGLRARA